MEVISKISKGTLMDQIYIPKKRVGLEVGSYVSINQIKTNKRLKKPIFHNISDIEPIKIEIINKIFENINTEYDNIIITGSFLEKGFHFNDIDIILVTDAGSNKDLEKDLENKLGIKIHLIQINNKSLTKGLNTDPLYQTMLSKCVSIKRFVYNIKPKINYKLLDLHLLRSKLLILNFDVLTGNQKYEMLRNTVAISLFIGEKELNKENIDKEIKNIYKIGIKEIKENMIPDKKGFSEKYNLFYKNLFLKIMDGVSNASK